MARILRIETARVFKPLLSPKRYKGAYGGRGSGKSHFFGEQVIISALAKSGYRFVCIREVQNTIKDSVKQLLEDKIQKFGLGADFEVTDSEIRGRNGSLIIFRGMQNYNAESIKSLEGFDGAWVEEAQTLSARSLKMLRPTIRKEGSEIWFSWNPRHDTDAVDKMFRQHFEPETMTVVKANWGDNPWFPDVLRRDMEADYRNDPDMAAHVWGGGYEIFTEAAYYSRQMGDAERDRRIGVVPHLPGLPVQTAWDIGIDDYTAIWFFQRISATRLNVIDYFEIDGEGPDYFWPELIEPKGHRYDRHFLPHDVKVREWGNGGKQRLQGLYDLGLKNVNIGVAKNPNERIAATRKILPICWFDETKCALGLKRLRGYSRKQIRATGLFGGANHDENSHGADAFGEYAVNARMPVPPKERGPRPPKHIDPAYILPDPDDEVRLRPAL